MKYIQTFESFLYESGNDHSTKVIAGGKTVYPWTWDAIVYGTKVKNTSKTTIPTIYTDGILNKMSNNQFQELLQTTVDFVDKLNDDYKTLKDYGKWGVGNATYNAMQKEDHRQMISKYTPYLTKLSLMSKERIADSNDDVSKEELNSEMTSLIDFYEKQLDELELRKKENDIAWKATFKPGTTFVPAENKAMYNQYKRINDDIEADAMLFTTQIYILKKNLK